MKLLTANEVHARKVDELGLDSTAVDLTSIEAIAGGLRRVASFLCPCAAATLIRNVVNPLRGLVDNIDDAKNLTEETLEAMIAHGDIFEFGDVTESQRYKAKSILYAAPASFVLRRSGAAILLGITSDQLSALPEDLEVRIEYVNHIRRLMPLPDEDLRDELVQIGLTELSYDAWLKSPAYEQANQYIERMNRFLDAANPSRDVPGLTLLDPERPVRFYPRRWVEPRSQTGRYLGRRKQAYGADLWCYVRVQNGLPERLIDLPLADSRWRGCDDGWRLQMAIDAKRGVPQRFRIRSGPADTVIFELFSPVPMWARRRWDTVGEPLPNSGCLFAYRIAKAEAEEELRFARKVLWLEELSGNACLE